MVRYVLVGVSNSIWSSADGVTWAFRYGDDGGDLFGIWHNGSLWVAVGGDGVLTSEDGITWVNQQVPFGDVRSVHYGGSGVWVAVGGSYTTFPSFGTDARLATSPDGITWTEHDNSQFEVDGFRRAMTKVFLNQQDCHWYAVGYDGMVFRTADPTAATGWAQVDPGDPTSERNYTALAVGDGDVWIGGAANGLFYSEDNGAAWTQVEGDLATYPTNFAFRDWDYMPSLGRWAGPGGTRMYVSANPKSGDIDQVIINSDTHRANGSVWSEADGQLVVVGDRNTVNVSTNGVTFTQVVAPDSLMFGARFNDVATLGDVRLCSLCPDYGVAVAGEVSAEARRRGNHRGRVEVSGVNQLAAFTDNMWCRRGSAIVPVVDDEPEPDRDDEGSE